MNDESGMHARPHFMPPEHTQSSADRSPPLSPLEQAPPPRLPLPPRYHPVGAPGECPPPLRAAARRCRSCGASPRAAAPPQYQRRRFGIVEGIDAAGPSASRDGLCDGYVWWHDWLDDRRLAG